MGKRKTSVETRAYRAVGLALAILAAAAAFYFADRPAPGAVFRDASPAGSGGAQEDFLTVLKAYPAPAAFRTISVASAGRFNPERISFSGTCDGGYYALVVFPQGTDYRNDPARAIMNRAHPCTAGQPFVAELSSTTVSSLPPGDYYAILADQGAAGLWYNPR